MVGKAQCIGGSRYSVVCVIVYVLQLSQAESESHPNGICIGPSYSSQTADSAFEDVTSVLLVEYKKFRTIRSTRSSFILGSTVK